MESDVKKYEFKEGLPLEFEILRLDELYQKHKDLLIRPHRAGFYNIFWFTKGSPTHLADFNPVKMKPNSMLFLNKDCVQVFDKKGNFDGIGILFTDAFFCRTEADIAFLRNSILFNDLLTVSRIRLESSRGDFASLLAMMESEIEKPKDACQPDLLKNLLHNFLLLAERERRKQDFIEIKKGPDLDYVLLFRDLVGKHFRTIKQVSHCARQIGVTEKRLNAATSNVLGKTPKQIIDERIMLEAKRLLAHTNESVKSIGFQLGFDEPTNFIKYFRKHHHSTPMEFREKYSL
jgi:AraC family transcriptional regulator, transcriptional activator of pobA